MNENQYWLVQTEMLSTQKNSLFAFIDDYIIAARVEWNTTTKFALPMHYVWSKHKWRDEIEIMNFRGLRWGWEGHGGGGEPGANRQWKIKSVFNTPIKEQFS